jgi:hypothetical protein
MRIAQLGLAILGILAACAEVDHPLTPKGPLAQWLPYRITSWEQCAVDSTTSYSPPFWRAPYRHCGVDGSDASNTVELDADTVVVSLHSTRRVPGPARTAEFEKSVLEMERRLGPPQRRSAQCAAWASTDTLQAEVSMWATGDVAPALYDQPWTIVTSVRRGLLDSHCSAS